MRLDDWLAINSTSRSEFAVKIGATDIAVGRYVTGLRLPNREAMRRIYQATAGEVMPNDFYELQ